MPPPSPIAFFFEVWEFPTSFSRSFSTLTVRTHECHEIRPVPLILFLDPCAPPNNLLPLWSTAVNHPRPRFE